MDASFSFFFFRPLVIMSTAIGEGAGLNWRFQIFKSHFLARMGGDQKEKPFFYHSGLITNTQKNEIKESPDI